MMTDGMSTTQVLEYPSLRVSPAMDPRAQMEALASIPQKRFGTPEEVAHAAVFLATNTYANNCVLNLDGALSAT
jgi:NAD(P)-dependent dehydrogenase (short-subunit alcohol dehydrogenase family)